MAGEALLRMNTGERPFLPYGRLETTQTMKREKMFD